MYFIMKSTSDGTTPDELQIYHFAPGDTVAVDEKGFSILDSGGTVRMELNLSHREAQELIERLYDSMMRGSIYFEV